MTLKTVLKNFLNYADTLEAQKKLGNDIYELDFQKLKALTEELKRDNDYATAEGLKEVNRRKNRYKDILPYDYTRVILSEYPGVPGSDFINANYIKGASGSLAYIASQGPLPNTVVDFWRMIWECEIQVIVMACNEQESGKYKCECYWPTDEEKKQYGNINVEFVKWRQVCPDFLVRTLKACWESEERVICQFHYTTWPDHGVPNSVQPILELVRLIRDCQASEAVPVLVHCSAGCGRTGTICAIDFVWGLMRMGKLTKNFNLFNVIADMRRQRIAMVQTKEQYVLVHKAVSSLFEQQLRVIDSHTYENLDEDGEPLILKEMQQEEDIYEDILDPPLEENYSLDENNAEKSMQLVKAFPELMYGPKDSVIAEIKKETYIDYLCHLKKISQNETSDTSLGEVKNSEQYNRIYKDDNKPENSSKETDFEADLHYSENSRTLQKLRREESVKRLISGWNKAVEHADEVMMLCKDSQSENQNLNTAMTKNSLLYEPKTSKDQLGNKKSDASFVLEEKTSKNVKNVLLNVELPKTSSPEDTHAGKLVGKATVIRRPSIAKLKALFEKSAQASVESADANRHRRTLFRSHSHYVSNSSRTFTLSESGDHSQSSNQSSESSYLPSREESFQNNDQRLSSERPRYCNDSTSRPPTDNSRPALYSDSSKQMPSETSPLIKKNSNNNNAQKETFSTASDSYSHIDRDSEERNLQLKKHEKDKPPSLPVKKKLPAPPVPSETIESSLPESTVPRFQVNLNKTNQAHSEYYHRNSVPHPKDNETNRTKDSTPEDSLREYRRHSHEAERKILHKNQSFSDPEQGSSRTLEANKQLVKPKSSLMDQTYPKLTYSSGKTASDDKLQFGLHESTYTNVNSLAQKNIRQIEDKLKNHPRGAIIDLTSRKSYIDEMANNTEKNYVFRNTSQPVKFLQPQESRDLTPQEKYSANKTDTASKSKTSESKESSNKNDSDPNSKNLLLHSPPPKSKRGHLSKGNSKSPISPPTSTESTTVTKNTITTSQQLKGKQTANKILQPANFILVNSPPNLNIAISNNTNVISNNTSVASNTSNLATSNPNPNTTSNAPSGNTTHTLSTSSAAPDRSDPRYFPVNRQTASDAKYESERHKALSRERSENIYETLYSVKSSVPVYQKLPLPYDKSRVENFESLNKSHTKDFKYNHEKMSADKEPLYGLQRSKSGPQVVPTIPGPTHKATQSCDLTKPLHKTDPLHYDQKELFHHSGGQQTSYMTGPPKPPRTFHYDQKNIQENVPASEAHKSETINRDGGRYIVTVASPKHSMQYPTMMTSRNGHNLEYRYTEGRLPDVNHHGNVNPPQYQYVPPPTKDVHMSRSYPFTNYDNLYSHPRPYGKQFHPESVVYRNVQPITHATNNMYSTIKEKPHHVKQDLYGTVKHRNTYSDYENVYDSQGDYRHAMSAPHAKSEHKSFCSPTGQYGSPDTNIYGVIQPHNHVAKSGHASGPMEYQNFDQSAKRVYFDTLQRKHKQHVSWEQRRSHDDMDIRPAPSARLREQIHARRSMVELDNLEISVVSDDGYSTKNIPEGTVSSPESHTKMENNRSETFNNSTSGKDYPKELHHKRSASHGKENTSFGETLSKAFGRLTSLTKFTAKDTQSSSTNNDSSNGTKVLKPKEPEKQQSFTVQSPESMKESPSEQWTQV